MNKRFPILLLTFIGAFLAFFSITHLLATAAPLPSNTYLVKTSLDWELDPIVVKGVFPGASIDKVFVYREVNGSLEQIPFQIDEVTSSGAYTSTEDLIMDANDQIVFMANDLGVKTAIPITNLLPINGIWYEIEVTDPLSPTARGWAYIVHSNELKITGSTDYVSFNPASDHIEAQNYSLGWAKEGYTGLNYLSILTSGNIIDRPKLRILYRYVDNPQQILTEEDVPVPDTILIKDGKVRVIVRRGKAITLAYGNSQRTKTLVDLSGLPPKVSVNEARLSLDMDNTISNATYYNENMLDGVAIDGTPDAVQTTPFNHAWHQISLDEGTFIHMIIANGIDGTISHYYKDEKKNDPDDTGDGKSFGDSGVKVINPSANSFVYESVYYFLPDRQASRGDELYNRYANPLSAKMTVNFNPSHTSFLPLTLINN